MNETQKLPPLTTAQKIRYSIFGLFFVAVIGLWIGWQLTDSSKNNDLKSTGVHAVGTANGDVYEYNDRSLRTSTVKYKAKYDYTYINTDRDGREEESTAIGEKVFDSKAEVEALKGKHADVYYDPNDAGKGTYVENEP